jgi:hypothetical protein
MQVQERELRLHGVRSRAGLNKMDVKRKMLVCALNALGSQWLGYCLAGACVLSIESTNCWITLVNRLLIDFTWPPGRRGTVEFMSLAVSYCTHCSS